MQTLDELNKARKACPVPPQPGSPQERNGISQFGALFARFTPESVHKHVPKAYAESFFFNDGLKTLTQRDALLDYMAHSADAVEACQVKILETTRTDSDEHLVRWKMMIQFKRFARGEETWTVGISHIRLNEDGMIIYQQDYWNAVDGLYRHIPVVGFAIRAIESRL